MLKQRQSGQTAAAGAPTTDDLLVERRPGVHHVVGLLPHIRALAHRPAVAHLVLQAAAVQVVYRGTAPAAAAPAGSLPY